jgi:hypothetical protein
VRQPRKQLRRNREAGFALLFVYAMAATVAIMLLMQLPSAAFEAQRNREQLLIDRGEQYSRAVQIYVRKFNRYPVDMAALENTQNQHFLRHRYTDPLTGKDEWRLIHVGPGGVFTDSLLNTKKVDPNAPAKQTFITELPSAGTDPATTTGVNMATRRFPPGTNPNGLPNQPQLGQPFPVPPLTGQPDGQQNQGPQNQNQGQQFQNNGSVAVFPGLGQSMPVQNIPGQGIPGQGGQMVNPNQPGQQIIPGGFPPGVQLPPGVQMPPGTQFQQGTQLPGQQGSVPGSGAANIINQLLTTPRPGGLNGLGGFGGAGGQQQAVDQFGNPLPQNQMGQPGQSGQNAPGQPPGQPIAGQPAGQTIGGGIAGVASKMEQEGIKRYRDRKLYNEWEFVYDITKDSARAGGVAQPGGAPGAGAQSPSGFGAAPGQAVPGQLPAQPFMPQAPGPPPQPPPPPPAQ